MVRCVHLTAPAIEAGCRPRPDELLFDVAYDGEWYHYYAEFHPCYPPDALSDPDAPDDPAPDPEDVEDEG
jgi:hypothetical protein